MEFEWSEDKTKAIRKKNGVLFSMPSIYLLIPTVSWLKISNIANMKSGIIVLGRRMKKFYR